MFKQVEAKPDFSSLDVAITEWWKQNNTFQKSVDLRKGAEDYIFYDGPPFMSGMPHYATLLSSLPKDVIPRYQTMQGKHVERVWGWDCHGLPIENKVENQLGLNGRKDIEKVGLETFIQKCYEWNRVGIENWRWYIDKIGRWADIDNAYRTMDQDYMESVWWTFKTMWDKGLVYKGMRTSLFSTDSSTPVSEFEVSMDPDNYRDTEDIAVTIKFALADQSQQALATKLNTNKPIYLLAWTTTPWTLASNFALAVNPTATYLAVEYANEVLIVNKERLAAVFDQQKPEEYSVQAEINPQDLIGLSYEQLYPFLPGGENDFKVYDSDYVTTEDGTGILHVAPAFGEADFEMGKSWNLSFTPDVDDEGKMLVGPWAGTYLRDANPLVTEDLRTQGKLFKSEKYVHRLPYYRYANPLIYKVQENYFVNIQQLKPLLLESNEKINWIPEYFKNGRFKYVLETAPDWSISRSRYWGTAMPIWRGTDGDEIAVGSRDDLMNLVNDSNLPTLRVQKVNLSLDENKQNAKAITAELKSKLSEANEVTIAASQAVISQLRQSFFGETEAEAAVKPIGPTETRSYYLFNDKPLDMHRPYIDQVYFVKTGVEYRRIAETLDVWMDSGSMPFAQFHYPFQNKEKFEKSFPGDFIAEYTGQIRAWFYLLHVVANALFEKEAFKNVLVTGVLAGTDGRKMSKSFGNYPDPKLTLETYGAEALRLYMLGSTLLSGNDMNFSEEGLKMQVREFLLPYWNTFLYLVTYANIHDWEPREELVYNKRNVWDDQHPWDHIPFDDIENELDAWVLTQLQNTIGEVTSSLDNYDIPKTIKSLREFLESVSKWYIRRSRARFAEGDLRALETLYYVIAEFTKLAAPIIPFTTEYVYQTLVAEQLTDQMESVHLTDYPVVDTKFLSEYAQIPNEMEIVRTVSELGQAIRALEGIKVRQPLAKLEVVLPEGQTLAPWMQDILASELNVLEVAEMPVVTQSETMKSQATADGKLVAALETKLTPELEEAGLLREVLRTIQAIRKTSGFQLGEKVKVEYSTDNAKLAALIEKNKNEIMEAVSAISLEATGGDEVRKVNEYDLRLGVHKV